MIVKQDAHDHPPRIKKQYGGWTIVGEPLPSLARNESRGNEYQTQWQVPCRCRCGRRDLVDVQDLEVGASIQCVVCDKFGFPESILIRPGKRSKVIEAFGEKKCICDWVKDPRCTCEHSASIRYRLKRGLSPEEAIASPRRNLGKHLNEAKKTRTQAKSRRENIYDNIPNIKKDYKDWTVVGEPLPFLNVNNSTKCGYQTRWKAPCECTCGRRDLIDIQNLMSGRSKRCIVCGLIAFDKIPRPGRPPKLFEAFGEKKSVKDWVKDSRCMYTTGNPIAKRLKEGMALEEIITNSRSKGHPRSLTNDQAIAIYDRANAGERGIDLAKEFGSSSTTVSHIKTSKMYADVTHNKPEAQEI